MVTSQTVQAEHDYPVLVGSGAMAHIGDHMDAAQRVAVIHTESVKHIAQAVADHLGDRARPVIVPDAETAKTYQVAEQLWEWLGEHQFTRRDTVVGVGGGAVTDLAGFVAATWMRGVRAVSVPTTVLGMVDAAVGGKTGINTSHGKNLVGCFASPHAVLCDTDTLQSLPARDVSAGLAEVIKCGFIADPSILDIIATNPAACQDWQRPELAELIERSIAVKADVVAQDFTESYAREALNFGHTFAHAIEATSGYTWRHGDAVAVGMRYVLLVQDALGEPGAAALHDRLVDLLRHVGLPTHYPDPAPWPDLMAAMQRDKKAAHGGIRFVTLPALGRTGRASGLVDTILRHAYDRVCAPV